MKTLKKIMFMFVAGVLAFVSYLATPLTKTVAYVKALAGTNKSVSIKQVPTEMDLSEGAIIIPYDANYFNGIPADTEGVVRIYNGVNRMVQEITNESTKTFAPKTAGNYTIVYGYKDVDGVFTRLSADFTLVVTGEVTAIEFAENSQYNIVNKVPNKVGQKINLPYPDVVLSDGTTLSKGDDDYNVTTEVSYIYTKADKSQETRTMVVNDHTDHMSVELTSDNQVGIYEVRYTYTGVNGNTVAIKTFEVVDSKDFDPSKLNYKASVTSWSNTETRYKGQEITLPTVTVKDESSNNVTDQTYTNIEVSYISDGVVQENTDNKYFELKGKKLIINENAGDSKYYQISYTVKNYFDKVIAEYDFKIQKATSYYNSPVVYAVNTYDNNEVTSAEHLIPKTMKYSDDTLLIVPAIYAKDVYGSTVFTYTRTVKCDYTDKDGKPAVKTINVEDDTEFKTNETATISLTEAFAGVTGTYTITYRAVSDKTNRSATKTYTVNVVSEEDYEESTPEITLPTTPTYLKVGEKTTIGLPTGKDTNDSALEYTLTAVNGTITPIYNDSYKLSGFEYLSNTTGEDTLTFTAKNDAGKTVSKTTKVVVIENDDNAPTYTITSDVSYDNEVIKLPTIEFADASNLEIFATVYDPNGKEINGVGGVLTNGKVVSGGSFSAGLSGVYTIIYTAIDPYNNATSVVVKTDAMNVSGSFVQTGLDSAFPTEVEPNTVTMLPKAICQLNGETYEGDDVELRVIEATGRYTMESTSRKFTAKEEGTFKFAYFYNDEQLTKTYTISVVDSTKPELNIDAYRDATIISFDVNTDTQKTIQIPTFNPSDNYTKIITEYGINITKDGNTYKTLKAKDVEEFYKDGTPATYSFNVTSNGVYVVEYYAVDNAGNKTTYKLDAINVGDVDTPVITFKGKVESTSKLNSTIKFNYSDIQVTDKSKDAKVESVKLKGPGGSVVTNTGVDGDTYAYKLTESGEYTLTITATDGQGHKNTYTKTITVATEEYDSKVDTQIIGIVLIVVSLLILAGVVFYFVKTRDTKQKKAKED